MLEIPAIGLELLEIWVEVPEWVHETIKFLTTKELPSEKEEARKVKNKSVQFSI